MTDNFESTPKTSGEKEKSMVKTSLELGGEITRVGLDNLDNGMIVDGDTLIDNDGNKYDKDGNLIEAGQKED